MTGDVREQLRQALDRAEKAARAAGGEVWSVDHHECFECDDPCDLRRRCAIGNCEHCVVSGDDITIYDEGGQVPMTADLVEWLKAQIAEDERLANAVVTRGSWSVDPVYRLLPGCRCLTCNEDEPYGFAIHDIDAVGEDSSPTLQEGDARHIAEHDPARALREVAAKRALLDEIFNYQALIDGEWGCSHDGETIAAGGCSYASPVSITAVRVLASVYCGRPGWCEEWSA